MKSYDIFNPTKARRVIYDGSPQQRKIQIDPGETKYGVPLEEHIVEQFGDGSDGNMSDLHITDANPQKKKDAVVEELTTAGLAEATIADAAPAPKRPARRQRQ